MLVLIIPLVLIITYSIFSVNSYVVNRVYNDMGDYVSDMAFKIENQISSIEDELIYNTRLGVFEDYTSTDNEDVRIFMSKYANHVRDIAIYTKEESIVFYLEDDYSVSKITLKNQNLEITDRIIAKKISNEYYFIVPIFDDNNIVNSNIMFNIDINYIISEIIKSLKFEGEYWAWMIDDELQLNPIKYSESKVINERFTLDGLGEIKNNIEQGLYGFIQNEIYYGNTIRGITSYSPVNYRDFKFAVGLSVNKDSLLHALLIKIVLLMIAFIVLIIFGVMYYDYLNEKKRKANEELIQSRNSMAQIIRKAKFGIILSSNDQIIESNSYVKTIIEKVKKEYEYYELMNKIRNLPLGESVLRLDFENSETMSLLLEKAPMSYKNENVMLTTFIDVTIINKAKEAAEEASNVKTRFIATISHEIRTPMNGIIASTELLEEIEIENEEARQYIDIIRSSSGHLLSMINKILDISKIESGKMKLYNKENNFEKFMREIYSQFIPLIDSKVIDYNLEIDEKIPRCLIFDEGKLRQVLINIIGNATKFTEAGSIILKATLLDIQLEKVNLRFEILDTGIGIPEDKILSIFEMFNQIHDEDSRQFQGSGLGVTISQQLLNLMGSSITVKSPNDVIKSEYRGTIFAFDINFALVECKIIPVESKKVYDFNILLAEDNKVNAKVTMKILNNFGCTVTHAENGSKVVELYDSKFDFVLMDIQMPYLDGFEATKKIKLIDKYAVVYALSANDEEVIARQVAQAGMEGMIEKPITKKKLLNLLKKIKK